MNFIIFTFIALIHQAFSSQNEIWTSEDLSAYLKKHHQQFYDDLHRGSHSHDLFGLMRAIPKKTIDVLTRVHEASSPRQLNAYDKKNAILLGILRSDNAIKERLFALLHEVQKYPESIKIFLEVCFFYRYELFLESESEHLLYKKQKEDPLNDQLTASPLLASIHLEKIKFFEECFNHISRENTLLRQHLSVDLLNTVFTFSTQIPAVVSSLNQMTLYFLRYKMSDIDVPILMRFLIDYYFLVNNLFQTPELAKCYFILRLNNESSMTRRMQQLMTMPQKISIWDLTVLYLFLREFKETGFSDEDAFQHAVNKIESLPLSMTDIACVAEFSARLSLPIKPSYFFNFFVFKLRLLDPRIKQSMLHTMKNIKKSGDHFANLCVHYFLTRQSTQYQHMNLFFNYVDQVFMTFDNKIPDISMKVILEGVNRLMVHLQSTGKIPSDYLTLGGVQFMQDQKR